MKLILIWEWKEEGEISESCLKDCLQEQMFFVAEIFVYGSLLFCSLSDFCWEVEM